MNRPLRWIALVLVATACADAPGGDEVTDGSLEPPPQVAFWTALEALCGQAFQGRAVESVPPDDAMESSALVMHVRECDDSVIRIPFLVGEDRSRTWVISRTETGLRLKHDHRHEDGTEDEVTQYGGDTNDDGSPTSQDFHADDFTAELVPAAATNIWTLAVAPDGVFVYALRRTDSDRVFRAEFDLRSPVDTPPPPWGNER